MITIKKIVIIAGLIGSMSGMTACGNTGSENLETGIVQVQQLDYENALKSFESAIVNGEDLRQAYRGEGLAYIGLTQYDKASACLEKALSYSDFKPDNMDYDINYYLATAYYKQGNLEEAASIYRAITALKPDEKNAWYLKGVIEIEQGNTEAAAADFDQALKIDPQDMDMRVNIYCVCEESGFAELGSEYLQTVLDSDSKISDYNRGRVSYYLGNYEDAKTWLEKSKDTAGVEAVRLLGQTYEKLNDYNYAASVYSNFLSGSQDAGIYNQLGLCYLKVQDYENALKAFQSGMAMEGNEIMQVLTYNEIVAYEYLGDFKQAAVLMQKYLTTYPDDSKAVREYEFLKTR